MLTQNRASLNGSITYTLPRRVEYYMALGLSEKYSRNVIYLEKQRLYSYVFGTAASFLTFYYSHFYTRNMFKSGLRAVAVGSLAFLFVEHYLTGPRVTANSPYAAFYSNNVYNKIVTDHVRTFRIFDRKFTADEKEHFNINERAVFYGPKRYHYNPYVHGDEQAHRKKHEFLTNPNYLLTEKSKQEIADDEKRIKRQLARRPANLDQLLDWTGASHSLISPQAVLQGVGVI